MKKLILGIITVLVITGCGDDVTNINGYTEEEVHAMIDSSLADREVVMMTDTVYQKTVDTIYNMVIDTVTKEIVDTIYERVIDTVYNELVDTIYNRVVDTVYKELVDTIYNRVIDTVYKTLEDAGINTEIPRDTSITLYDTTDNQITARIYKGVVYKNVFYDTTKYKFNEGDTGIGHTTIFRGWNSTNYHITTTDRCGLLENPTWKDFGWDGGSDNIYQYKTFKKIKGWRLFDAKDANALRNNLDMIISDDSEVYLSTIKDSEALYEFEANVATQYAPNQTSKGKRIKYMCAYDL